MYIPQIPFKKALLFTKKKACVAKLNINLFYYNIQIMIVLQLSHALNRPNKSKYL